MRLGIWFLLFLCLSTLGIGLRLYQEQVVTIPHQILVQPYSDQKDDPTVGNSTIFVKTRAHKSKILHNIKIHLRPGYSWPYAGVEFMPTQDSILFDAGQWDKIVITFLHNDLDNIMFLLHFKMQLPLGTQAHLEPNVLVKSYEWFRAGSKQEGNQGEITLPLQDFKVPSWWIAQNNLENINVQNANTNLVTSLSVQNGTTVKTGTQYSVGIVQIKLVREFSWWYWVLVACVPILVLMLLIQKYANANKPNLKWPLAQVHLESSQAEPIQLVMECFANHYLKREFDLPYLSKICKVPESKCSEIILSHTGGAFKKYLNELRMQEACRLLQSTNEPASSIAYLVGYNSPHYFNRLFKKQMGTPPGQYRLCNQKSENS